MYILLFLILFCIFICDLRFYKVPNKLLIVGTLGAITYNLYCGSFIALASNASACLFIFFSLYSFYQIGILGAGDIKLFMMMSLFLNISQLLIILLISFSITLFILIVLSITKCIKINGKSRIPLGVSVFFGYGFWFIYCFL